MEKAFYSISSLVYPSVYSSVNFGIKIGYPVIGKAHVTDKGRTVHNLIPTTRIQRLKLFVF